MSDMTNTNTTHNYRGFRIVKHDTGSRRLGRDIVYTVTDPTTNEVIMSGLTLRNVKAGIDAILDVTDASKAHADAVAAMLLGGAR